MNPAHLRALARVAKGVGLVLEELASMEKNQVGGLDVILWHMLVSCVLEHLVTHACCVAPADLPRHIKLLPQQCA